ncbi:LysR substrate-binding domain-containing protein [Paenibacillus motobuensis]|uniref:LysR family transcriptional regulator n=1 Tax=Paenibacillus TaxID=44249 RepID=UPI00203F173D|nr:MULTISPECIES: LysR substrate-binding domain-containing protein [Paenibacillus]MCM3039127.1 LysR substrate-binding domain-containing protein [Paenibacillus lutimineralis]MCM3646231.1 LysR substrate-binding domain-containing protein [Paenibacillus motobuensis]
MEHRLLEYFLAVCEELHFTRAAEKLGISQPTLSHQIRLLERELGAPLFHRSGKKTILTQAGQILLGHAHRVINEIKLARQEINELSGLQRGKLRIGCSGNHLLTDALVAFHRLYPGIELTVTELATEETRDGLLHNHLDVGVVFLPLFDEQLAYRPLYDEELVLAISSSHEYATCSNITIQQLANLPLVLFPQKFLVRQMIDSACAELEIQLNPVMELSTLESQLHMAEQNVGGTILPKSYGKTVVSDKVAIIPLADPAPRKKVGLVYRKDTLESSIISAFVDHLISF